MKIPPVPKTLAAVVALALTACASFHAAAQTVQYVTLSIPPGNSHPTYPVQTNQLVSIIGVSPGTSCLFDFPNGAQLLDNVVGHVYIGLTNIELSASSSGATFQITTPASAAVVTNYVPADAIVIPASATGNVQIILESSPDLVNWTAAQPGIYGPSAATNRFFRVRAVAN